MGMLKRIYKKVEDYLLGSKAFLRIKLEKIYDSKEADAKLEAFRKRHLFYYGMLTIVGVLSLVIGSLYTLQHADSIKTIKRPAYYENSKHVSVHIEGRYADYTQKKGIELVVKPELLSKAESEKLFNQSEEYLRKIILGKNKAYNQIIYPLNLPKKEKKTKVKITWESEEPDVIDENGYVNTFIEEEQKKVKLVAKLEVGNYTRTVPYHFTVKKEINTANIESNMTDKLEAETKDRKSVV